MADDDPVVRMLIASAVRSLGVQVDEAADGASAVANAQQKDGDLDVDDLTPRQALEKLYELRQMLDK